jgi:thiol-disulfide isomerase/thioredoxin
LLSSFFGFAQTDSSETAATTITDKNGNPMLLGKCNINALEQPPFSTWFKQNYDNYKIDSVCCELISEQVKDVSFLLFFGSWCGDSKRVVPRMMKVLEESKLQTDSLELVGVSNHADQYKKSPSHEEQGKNIVRVPTLIVYRAGAEIGRIIETPIESIERDLLAIISGKPYRPNYADRRVE